MGDLAIYHKGIQDAAMVVATSVVRVVNPILYDDIGLGKLEKFVSDRESSSS